VFVWSSARAQAAAISRAKKLGRARADLERVRRGLGSPHYRTVDKVAERVATIARSRKVTGYLRAQTGTDPATGKPILSWSFDQAALDAEQATDGWYGLLTNLTVEQADAAEARGATRAKRQSSAVTARSRAPRGRAHFLKTNRRIAAPGSVICLALLVFCLVERAVRKAIVPPSPSTGWMWDVPPSRPDNMRSLFRAFQVANIALAAEIVIWLVMLWRR
jgi:hypothetical protein